MIVLLVAGCDAPQRTQSVIQVTITADGRNFQVQVPAGSTTQDAFSKAGIAFSALDRSEPPLYTVLTDGAGVNLVRVREDFEIQQVIIPYEHQVLRNESLPAGETRLSQPGENGLQEITYRRVYEDGVEISSNIVKQTILREAVPEIVMVGSQTPYTSLQIPGRLVYLSAGNAWVMEGTTGNRRPLVTSGDLDGRIFNLSKNGSWLLFTRNSPEEDTINSLWAARVDEGMDLVIDLKARNVIHFAGWSSDSHTVAYSTVEPRSSAPGWQANNDLHVLGISDSGFVSQVRAILEPNSGGVYGWWGMSFAWAPDGSRLAYARPDSVGLVDLQPELMSPLVELIPFQSGSDWAWVPGLSWGADGQVLFTVDHIAPPGSPSPETSPVFDLAAIPLNQGVPLRLVSQVGMFAYPVTSPILGMSGAPVDETDYRVAYLQAVLPSQSESSRYRLVVMDRDGSNRKVLFPAEGVPGLDPQKVAWSPAALDGDGSFMIGVVYQDNIWLVDVEDGHAQQITGDGLTSHIDWK